MRGGFTMAEFPPPTHVTLTRPNLSVSIPRTQCLPGRARTRRGQG
jgi:hypothetical protein